MVLEGELVFKGVEVFGERVAVDQPDVEVKDDVLVLVVGPPTRGRIGRVVVTGYHADIPESEEKRKERMFIS